MSGNKLTGHLKQMSRVVGAVPMLAGWGDLQQKACNFNFMV
jgi:hypothetical protein